MATYRRLPDLIAAGYFRNRVTCERWIERGIFPPPVKIGPNTNAWSNDDLEEFDQRVRAGITGPHSGWLARAAERKARNAAE